MLRAIVGEVNPSGKLNETYPLKYEDTPSAPYFPAKERTAEYREGLYVGYRYFETVNKPVRYPFGYGLSYTTFGYSELSVKDNVATFTLKNQGSVDGAEVAQLYVSAKGKGVYRPVRELKGFAKVFLKAGETKTVSIPLDDKAFRYFNTKTNRFEIETGEYEIQIGGNCADIRLREYIFVQGTEAPQSEKAQELPSYFSGNIEAVSDEEFTALLGHEIPDGHWSGELDANDAICQLYYAKSPVGRLVYRILTNMLEKSMAKGKPDLNIMFIYNMPFRGIGKMAGGVCSQYMVDGIVRAVNGHFFSGLGQIISGFFKQRKVMKKANNMK
jgi:beta-glucosidase